MSESGHSTVATTLKTAVDAEQMVESQEDTVQGLFSAVAHVKTMPARDVIKDDFGEKLPSGRPDVQTSARVRFYPTDAILPADGFLPSTDVVKTASAWPQ
jgi:hypothetical protein